MRFLFCMCVAIGSTIHSAGAGELPVAPPPRPVDAPEAKRARALNGCRSLETAIEAYMVTPRNKTAAPPATLADLVKPQFGGASFLRNGLDDLIDPWGNPYKLTTTKRPDGSLLNLISTETPESLPISQFGIGAKAKPPAK